MSKIQDFVSREAFEKIVEFEKFLLKWNKTINLIASVQLLPFIEKESKIIDLGSGAGFTVIILSIAGVSDITYD